MPDSKTLRNLSPYLTGVGLSFLMDKFLEQTASMQLYGVVRSAISSVGLNTFVSLVEMMTLGRPILDIQNPSKGAGVSLGHSPIV